MSEENKLPEVSDQEAEGKLEELGVKPELVQALSVVISRKVFSGPLPPSEHFASYEQTLPGTAQEIVTCMKKEQDHRQALEERSMSLQEKETTRGQLMAYSIALLLVIGAIVCAVNNQPVLAGIFLGSAALGAVKHLIDGRKH